jgi:hypothetical protein
VEYQWVKLDGIIGVEIRVSSITSHLETADLGTAAA